MSAFYQAALGLALVSDADGLIRLGAGGAELALHAIPPHVAAHIEIADPPAARSDSAIKLCFGVEDLEGTRAALIARGTPMREVHRTGAIAHCDGLDPEGNVFQITTR